VADRPSIPSANDRQKDLIRSALKARDYTAWFEPLYREANGNPSVIPWADMVPSPALTEALAGSLTTAQHGPRVVVVGCGLGDDAMLLDRHGWNVTAFDVAPTAIDWARRRVAIEAPDCKVTWEVADLFRLPPTYHGAFDLAVEIYTVQALPPRTRAMSARGLRSLLKKGGTLMMGWRHDELDAPPDGPPWGISTKEFERHFLQPGMFRMTADPKPYVEARAPDVPRRWTLLIAD